MSKPLFGQILDPDLAPTRDAVHIPIIPVTAGTALYAGERLRFQKQDGAIFAYPSTGDPENYIAVADPFMRGNRVIPDGSLFYAWLRPESTQKLWHEWTHRELDR